MSALLVAVSLELGDQQPLIVPLASAASFALTAFFARFPTKVPDDLDARSELLNFCADLSVEMSSGLSAESALSRRIQGEAGPLSSIRDLAALRLLSGESATRVMKLLPGDASKVGMMEIFSELVGSGGGDSASALPFLDLWAENLATAIESRRSFEEVSRRAEFLHYLISFTMGFLSASASFMSKLRSPYYTQPGGLSPQLMFVSLFFLNSSTFTICSRRFRFGRPLVKFAIGSLIMTASFVLFSRLLSAF